MKKILITGAEGFIGRNFIRRTLNDGYEIYALVYPGDEDVFSEYEGSGKLHVYSMDCNSIFDYYDIFPTDIDALYHLAWQGVRPELRNDMGVQLGNINMTMQVMRFAANKKIKAVVFPGSTNEYLYYGKPLDRNALPSPSDAYGAVKTALRYLCFQFSKQFHIKFIYTIIAGIYSEDRKDNNVIFYTIEKLLNGEKPSLTKCEQMWDYVHIDDVVDALVAVGDKGQDGGIYAIGHGDNQPLKDYIMTIHEMIDPTLPLGFGEVPYNSTQIPSSCIDMTDLYNDTGFVPQIDFREGISRVIDRLRSET